MGCTGLYSDGPWKTSKCRDCTTSLVELGQCWTFVRGKKCSAVLCKFKWVKNLSLECDLLLTAQYMCVWLRMGYISTPQLCRWNGVKRSENSFPPLELTLSSKRRGSGSAGKHIPLAREKDSTFTLPFVENKPKLSEKRNFRLDSGVMLTSLWDSPPQTIDWEIIAWVT